MSDRIQKNLRIRREIAAEFVKISTILGLKEQEAAELALAEWAKKHEDEAQKKLDLYAERGITIIEPQTVNIAVFQKAEILLAKEELRRVIGNYERGNPEYHHDLQLEMARALRWIQPIYNRTRDLELRELLQMVEKYLASQITTPQKETTLEKPITWPLQNSQGLVSLPHKRLQG